MWEDVIEPNPPNITHVGSGVTIHLPLSFLNEPSAWDKLLSLNLHYVETFTVYGVEPTDKIPKQYRSLLHACRGVKNLDIRIYEHDLIRLLLESEMEHGTISWSSVPNVEAIYLAWIACRTIHEEELNEVGEFMAELREVIETRATLKKLVFRGCYNIESTDIDELAGGSSGVLVDWDGLVHYTEYSETESEEEEEEEDWYDDDIIPEDDPDMLWGML